MYKQVNILKSIKREKQYWTPVLETFAMETEADLKLLKRLYKEAPSSGPDVKKVKFSHMKDEVQRHCLSSSVTTQSLSRAISAQFPNTEGKHLGKARHLECFWHG